MLCPYCSQDYKNLTQHIRFKHPETQNIVSPQPQATPIVSQTLQQRKEELEMKRLEIEEKRAEIELGKLSKGESQDPWAMMLQITKENNTQQLAMMDKMNDLKIENLKLELGGGGSDDLPSTLFSMLPEMLKNIKAQPTPEVKATSGSVTNTPTKTEEVKIMDTSAVPNSYKQAIIDGKITEEQAYKDAKRVIKMGLAPQGTKLPTKKEFHDEFEKMKHG
jgi:hypothetical protein